MKKEVAFFIEIGYNLKEQHFMKRHIVKFEDIQNFKFEILIACSFGRGEHKELYICTFIYDNSFAYEVRNHQKVVLSTSNIMEALEKYNEI